MEAATLSERSSREASRGQKKALDAPSVRGRVVERLTEDCTGRIVTGETGLAHTRTSDRQLMSRESSFPSRCCGGLGPRCESVGATDADRPSTAGMARVVIRG
jgi:hypothetical protein